MTNRFNEPSPEQIKAERIYAEYGLTDHEYDMIVDQIGRLPNYTETGLFSGMWSEHCSYKNSKSILRTFPNDGPQVLQGPGEGAGIVDIGDGQGVSFKAESHNHPSAVEPYQGAATGIGGVLRDIFSMGARPVASLAALRFGQLDDERTKVIFEEVGHGAADYSNIIGVPTVGIDMGFDESYLGNPLVNVMNVGIVDQKNMQVGQASGVGNIILYAGSETGRDGIHGASFSSAEFSDDAEGQGSAVQAGDPFLEKQLMEACLYVIENFTEELIGIQDMGAAGLVSSSSEMASKAGSGLRMDLEKVPTREEGMSPFEIMLSESQERMLLCVKKGTEQKFIDLFESYGLNGAVVGEVTDGNRYQLYYEGELFTDLPVDSLAEDAPEYQNEAVKPARLTDYEGMGQYQPKVDNPTAVLTEMLGQPTIASKEMVHQKFDQAVNSNTLIGAEGDASVVRISEHNKAISMTTRVNTRFTYLNPEIGGQMAVAEAARDIVATGGKPLAITDGLNFGNPKNPEIFFELKEGAKGISAACLALDTPVISGNVSMNNEYNGEAVHPTPVIGMVGLIKNADHTTGNRALATGDAVYVLGQTTDAFNGSEIQKMQTGDIAGPLANFDLNQEKANQDAILEAIQAGYLASAHNVNEGGLAVAFVETVFDTNFGLDLQIDLTSAQLFAEDPSRFVVTVAGDQVAAFEAKYTDHFTKVGQVTDQDAVSIKTTDGEISASRSDLEAAWKAGIPAALKK